MPRQSNRVAGQRPRPGYVQTGKHGRANARNVLERREKVWALLVSGRHTYRDIARECSVDVHTAHDDVQIVLKEANERVQEMAHGYVAEQDAQLRRAIQAIEKDITDDSPLRHEAIDRLVKVTRELAKLHGLDKPIKVAQTDPSGDYPALDLSKLSQETLDKLLAELGAK